MNELINGYLSKISTRAFYSFPNRTKEIVNIEKVYACISSSKFRKTHIDDESRVDIYNKIQYCLDRKQPLAFSLPFGAYKSWRLNLDFRPDWAEVFNMSFLTEYAAHIMTEYPYGVQFMYTYQDNIMHFVNDIPRNKADQYVVDFKKLLGVFNRVHPLLHFGIIKINEMYNNPEEYFIDFLGCFLDNLIFWEEKYDDATKQKRLTSSSHNIYPSGIRNIYEREKSIQDKYIYYSALMTDAVENLKERRKYNKNQEKIQLVGVRGPSKSINIGACSTSTVHFWVGQGCLCYKKGRLMPYVFTYSTMEKIFVGKNYDIVEVNQNAFSDISNNYNSIIYVNEYKT